ncbi:hypothetical protein FSP39_006106 [Pinctada imbricata]|uniref:RNA-directed DNA polymerase n=1 Tax=Pinctada imbricata TaxID=66713 RepID=A0AA88XMR2_PINIB|nr:hypothetical protein FSP39_006106 [Pinctada imbricata]
MPKMSLPTFPKFDIHSNENSVGIRWTKYVNQLENLFVAMDISSKKRKKALLLHYAGEDVFDIHQTLPDTSAEDGYDQSKTALTNYFQPQVNREFEVFEFRQMKQLQEETVDQFATRLRQKSKHCDFADNDGEIKSQIIQGCTSNDLRRKALRDNLDLTKLLSTARAMEIANKQADKMRKSEETNAVRQKTFSQPNIKQSTSQSKEKKKQKCRNCGGRYPHRSSCPAFGKICDYCKKENHFASQCLKRKTRERRKVQNVDENSASSSDGENSSTSSRSDDETMTKGAYSFGVKAKVHQIGKLPKTEIRLNDHKMKIIVDTGSSINIVEETTVNKMRNKPKLQKSDISAFAYGQKEKLRIRGKFSASVESKDKIVTATFYVVPGDYGNLLSYATAVDLNIIPVIQKVKIPKKELTEEYRDVFEGFGKLKDKRIKIHIDENIAPVAEPHRRIPFHVRNKVEEELKRLEQQDVIEKAVGPTPWVSPIVVAPRAKNPNQIRICVDMRKANKAIKRERHLTPTIDDLIMDLNGAKVFSKLDLRNGFHQLELEPESRYVTTFSTHVGLWRYKRLNFGISAAPEIFHNEIRQALQGLKGVRNLSDDIIVFGSDQKTHDANLRAVLQRLREKNLTLNKEKCSFNQNRISFFGYVFSAEGISADPKKVEAIKDAKKPSNQSEIKSFLGMTNYVSRFIPDYSTITDPLRKLLRDKTPWKWTSEQDNAFEKVKRNLTSDRVMTFFDPRKQTELHVDASPVGLAAVMSQENKIVAYASRALTPVEQRYSQTEREALAIVWGCEHFHLYLFGKPFTLITDHKPLEYIFQKPKAKQNLRLERWRLRLTTYNFKVKYMPGITNAADYLSRHPLTESKECNPDEHYIRYVTENAVPRSMQLDEIIKASQHDPVIPLVIEAVTLNHWDPKLCKDNKSYNCFSRMRNELTVVSIKDKCILLRGTRIVIPESLQRRAISIAHEGHQGITKTKQLLREKVWFPYIDDLTEQMCKSCITCLSLSPTNTPEPLKMSELPSKPWDEVSVDFFGPIPNGDYIMVVIDDYSRFPVIEIMTSISARTVIPRLDGIFATFGIPSVCKSDNGPPFNGSEFRKFADYLGFKHRKITPLHPEANGLVEKFMQPLQKIIKAANIENKNYRQELHQFLRNYRATPHSTTGISPAEILFSRTIKTKLPEMPKSPPNSPLRNNDASEKSKNKKYADSKRKGRESSIKEGDQVLVKQRKRDKLTPPFHPKPAKVIRRKKSMITVNHEGKEITRDASHFKPLPTGICASDNQTPYQSPTPSIRRRPKRNRQKPARYRD